MAMTRQAESVGRINRLDVLADEINGSEDLKDQLAPGVVVLISSVKYRELTLRLLKSSTIAMRSRKLRASRSIFQTISVSSSATS